MEQLRNFWALVASGGIPASVLLLLSLFILRWLLLRYLRRESRISQELRLRWQTFIKNAFVLAGFIGLILIWAPQLRAFALSLTAVVVAIVIATKELILCISGSLLRASSSTFFIGDLVEYAGHTGYVVDQSLLTTEVQEVSLDSGALSGNQIILPNSLFLTHAVTNYSQLRPFCVHSFTLYMDTNQAGAVDAVTAAVEQEAEAISRATLTSEELERLSNWKRQLLQTSAPKIRLTSSDIAKIGVVVTIVCRDSEAASHQANIARSFFRALANFEDDKLQSAPEQA